MDLKDISVYEDQTVLEALKKLNRLLYVSDISSLILFVLNADDAVIGSLTDGDVRRSLVDKENLSLRAGAISNKNFSFVNNFEGFLDLSPYRKKNLKILPVLDEKKGLVRVIDLEKTRSILPVECMIMAGGRGKRLSPLTDTVPKPMLPLGNKPIMEHNIDRLISFGIKKIYISVKYLGEQIQDYFGDGRSKGIKIEYVWEDEPLGTAGALSLVERFETDHVLLMNSDLFTNVDFEDLYLDMISNKADMAVASTEYKVDVPYAVFETEDDRVIRFKEKPSYIYPSNAGVYLLKQELIQQIPRNKFYDITELMDELVRDGKKLIHNPIRGYWIDIGKPSDYKQAQDFVKHLI